MKTFLLLILLTMTGSAGLYAQNHLEQPFILDSLPPNGVVILDKGWKFHPGDNPDWAQPDVEDSLWQPINPVQGIHALPQIRQAQIGWLRLKIKLGKKLQGQTVAVKITQSGASEIYLNGKLVYQTGKVSADFNQERTFNPGGRPFTIQFSDAPEQVLAVRYSFSKGNLYLGYLPGFIMELATMERAWVIYTSGIIFSMEFAFVVGVFLILSILHLLLHVTYPGRKANLYFSLYTFCMGLAFLQMTLGLIIHSASAFSFSNIWEPLTINIAFVFYLQAVYALFNQRRGIIFKVLVSYFLLTIVLYFIPSLPVFRFAHYITTIIVYTALIHISWIAMREKQKGAPMLFLGQIITLLFYCLLIIAAVLFQNNVYSMFYSVLVEILFVMAYLCPPVIISMLLAREFAQTNFSLKQQLEEVKRLSEQTVAQEQEKQQLLANQKIEKIHFENELKVQKLENEKTKAELKQQASELEMQALRAQMNPHFIFNSLNSINMFILENNKLQASEYLSKFSRLIRLILQNSKEALIPLESELEALQLYLELESLRFENKFEYKIAINDNVDTTALKVPPLIIQPYAENAIWHGLMHKKEKGHLEIELYQQEETLFCKIIDDGIGRKRAAELDNRSGRHKSMGMKITENRIAMMQKINEENKLIEIMDLVDEDGTAAGTEVVLKIPVAQI